MVEKLNIITHVLISPFRVIVSTCRVNILTFRIFALISMLNEKSKWPHLASLVIRNLSKKVGYDTLADNWTYICIY